MFREKEKKSTLFKSFINDDIHESSYFINPVSRNQNKNRIASFFDQIHNNLPLGKNLTYGRRIKNLPNQYFEKDFKLELKSKQSISSNEETKANNSSNSSDEYIERPRKKSPTHFLIPYCKRNDEKFKRRIIRKLKEKPKKKQYGDDKFANTKYKPPDTLNKRMKFNSTKKMFIEDIKFEYVDNITNKRKNKRYAIYKENEVGFTEDWQEFLIEMSNDDDMESEDEVIEKGIESSLRELEDGFVEFHKEQLKKRKCSRTKK